MRAVPDDMADAIAAALRAVGHLVVPAEDVARWVATLETKGTT